MNLTEVFANVAGADGAWTVHIDDTWTQGRAMYGGVVTAVGNEVLRRLVPSERALRSLQTTFVGPATPGTWRIAARVLRVGRAVTIAQCEILDNEQVSATIVGVYGMSRESVARARPAKLAASRHVDEIKEVRYRPELGMPAFMQHFAVRWAEGAKPFSRAERVPTKAYIRHRDPAPLGESHVVALIDCIPTPAMSMLAAPAPASSLVWTLEFFEHRYDFPPNAWWRIDTDIVAAADGYVHQTGVLNDPNGVPVALSRQIYAVFG